ncbi:TIGR02285 family protein [Pseudoalteromonas sp.]|uniref:TIGR02285 family protein n=1 Tax=Pseudoalteromonas sp. TaxID=53249 RepID=UPI0035685412
MRILLLLLLLPTYCLAEIINWVVVDYPPYYILEGDLKGQGRDELVIDLVSANLVGYQFKRHVMPASRAVKALAKDDEVFCMASLYRNEEREKFIHFTDEFSTLGLSPAIAMRKSTVDKLQLDNQIAVSLTKLIMQNGLTIGTTLNRSFGKEIDEIISLSPEQQISARAGRDTLESLTYMLLKGRVDIILGYPSEHTYLKSLMDKNNELMQLTVLETKAVSKGYIGCSKNKQGVAVIKAINAVLSEVNRGEQFKALMLRWLPKHISLILIPYL